METGGDSNGKRRGIRKKNDKTSGKQKGLEKHFLVFGNSSAQIRVVNKRRKIHKAATVRSLSPKLMNIDDNSFGLSYVNATFSFQTNVE